MARDRDKVRQVAALPWRRSAVGVGIEVMLMTSRETRRPVIPKGWPMKGLKDRKAAAVEALEEAGLEGWIARNPFGSYAYFKRGRRKFTLVEVDVYPLEVTGQRVDWKEKGQRELAWVPGRDAALLVDEPALSTLVNRFVDAASKAGGSDRGG